MRSVAILLAIIIVAPVLSAQSVSPGIVSVPPQQCVWRAGDNPAWAAPNLDESGWQPYAQWKLNPKEPHTWVRCRADLSSLGHVSQPALQITLYAAYQVFADGRLVGTAGNLRSGAFTMNTVRDWPLGGPFDHPETIAIRITQRIAFMVPEGALPPLEIRAASQDLLSDRRSSVILQQIRLHLVPAVCFSLIGVAGLVLLALWFNDRSRYELLLLGLACVPLAPLYLNYVSVAALIAYPVTIYLAGWAGPAILANLGRTVFPFTLARRRVGVFFWILIGIDTALFALMAFVAPFLPPARALRLDALRSGQLEVVAAATAIFECLAPFVAFLPWKRLTRRMRPLAALSMAWGVTMMAFFSVRLTGTRIPGIPNLEALWSNTVSDAQAFAILSVIICLLALLFREQQQTARERAVLAGEMRAASEIQQMLAPVQIDTVPGLRIDVAFRPMREVGGDFYLCRVLADGRQRVLIGDVSGKGAAAAMAATLLLGAAAARDSDSPAVLLVNLNRVLRENHLTGFATCLCADITADGDVRIANAGHLLPYCNGREVDLESGLPLGILAKASYSETTLRIAEGDTLTLLSDGVVEARNAAGELFGFDRASAISSRSAEEIVQAAQTHGQEDDITVLTLTLAGAPAHA